MDNDKSHDYDSESKISKSYTSKVKATPNKIPDEHDTESIITHLRTDQKIVFIKPKCKPEPSYNESNNLSVNNAIDTDQGVYEENVGGTDKPSGTLIKFIYQKVLTMDSRFERLENLLTSIAMMNLNMQKRHVNKEKKNSIDEMIRRGFDVNTSRQLITNMRSDLGYFERPRKNSMRIDDNSSVSHLMGSQKQ